MKIKNRQVGICGGTRDVIQIVIALILAAGLGVFGYLKNKEKETDSTSSSVASPTSEGKRAAHPKKKSASRAPKKGFEFPDTAKTEAEILEETILPWLRENWQASGLLVTDGGGISSEKWKPFVEAAIQREVDGPGMPTGDELVKMAEPLIQGAKENPISAYVVGRSLGEHVAAKKLLAEAFVGFSNTKGAEILAWHAAVEWAMTSDPNEERAQERAAIERDGKIHLVSGSANMMSLSVLGLENVDPAEACIAALEKALSAHNGFADFHDRLSGFLLLGGQREGVFEAIHEPVQNTVAANDAVKPWLKKWVQGKHFHQAAWDARGGGYGNTVSDQGWALYKRNMIKARKAMSEAWDMGPQHAGVASDLIYAALAESKSGDRHAEMRRWFSEISKVQVDYSDAHMHMLWGFRKRWGGSHRMMTDFGEDCLNSGRFDSSAPWWYLQSLKDTASEWDLPPAFWPKFRDYDNLDRLFEGFENEAKREPWRQHDRTQAVITYFLANQYDAAKKWLDLLGDEPFHEGVLASWDGVDTRLIVGKTKAFTGKFADELKAAQVDEQRFRAAAALEKIDAVLKKAGDDFPDEARSYLEYRREINAVEAALADGDEIKNFGPNKDGLGWVLTNAEDETFESGLKFSGKQSPYYSATCEARVGARFVMEGTISSKNVKEGAKAWIAFGYPEQGGERWGTVSFVWQGERSAVMLTNAFNPPEETNEIELGESAEFKLSVSSNGISLWINDKQIWDDVPIPRHFVKEIHSRIGFGALMNPAAEVEFSNITFSR